MNFQAADAIAAIGSGCPPDGATAHFREHRRPARRRYAQRYLSRAGEIICVKVAAGIGFP